MELKIFIIILVYNLGIKNNRLNKWLFEMGGEVESIRTKFVEFVLNKG